MPYTPSNSRGIIFAKTSRSDWVARNMSSVLRKTQRPKPKRTFRAPGSIRNRCRMPGTIAWLRISRVMLAATLPATMAQTSRRSSGPK